MKITLLLSALILATLNANADEVKSWCGFYVMYGMDSEPYRPYSSCQCVTPTEVHDLVERVRTETPENLNETKGSEGKVVLITIFDDKHGRRVGRREYYRGNSECEIQRKKLDAALLATQKAKDFDYQKRKNDYE